MVTVDPGSATVFIVDDDDDARQGLQRFLKSCTYQTEAFASASEFLARLPVEGVSCLLLDLQMPEMTGIELQQELVAMDCRIPIIFLTAHGDIPTSVKAIKRGAEDFLPKLASEQDLLHAVERGLQRSREKLLEAQQNHRASMIAASLTDREREVCEYVLAGLLNKQIAAKLGIVERTVKAHRAKVMTKFGVASVAELVRAAELAGIRPAAADL